MLAKSGERESDEKCRKLFLSLTGRIPHHTPPAHLFIALRLQHFKVSMMAVGLCEPKYTQSCMNARVCGDPTLQTTQGLPIYHELLVPFFDPLTPHNRPQKPV